MNNPTVTSVDPTVIGIQWSTITLDADTGRDPVIYYHVKWQYGGGTPVYLTNYPTTTTLLTSFTHTLTANDPF